MRPTVSRPRASCSSPRPSFTPNDLYSVDRRTPLSSAVSVTEAQLDQVATPHTATEQVEEMPGVEVDSFDVDEFGYPEDHWVDYNGGSGADPPSAPIFSTVASLSRPSSSPSPVPYSSTLPRSESLSLSHTAPTTDDASPNPTSEPLPPSTSSSSPSHGPLPLPPWTNLLPQPFSKSSKKRKRKTTETSLLSSAILASGSTPTIAHVSAEESDAHSSGYPVITYRLRGESGDIVMKEDYMANFIQVSADTKQWEKERSNRKKVKGKKVAWAPDVGFMHDDDSVHIKDEDFDVGLPGERSETQSRSGGHIRNEESHT
ncbi:hypothetical protein BDP27DRAFT_1342539 [Rhodocollybia butyracea]|uniref:Uncharacterized protein n=1 Tax=Rhodocollybia butyracea TaxID=206335 RepID=A0A9P5P9U3_9AGAR|nr:hypothetical protein BDP27DRAFT_1342539 [Rhodocollybia butyracea]